MKLRIQEVTEVKIYPVQPTPYLIKWPDLIISADKFLKGYAEGQITTEEIESIKKLREGESLRLDTGTAGWVQVTAM